MQAEDPKILSRRLRHRRAGSARAGLAWLLALVDDHDSNTGGHSRRVAEAADAVSRMLGLAGAHISMIREVALLHDIGKVVVPRPVLAKPGPLDHKEQALLQLHPLFSASIIARVKGLTHLVPAVLHHHESWDGSGYPRGLCGPAIPLEARIVLVADAYDAMTSFRPYAAPRSSGEAVAEIESWAGHRFDPRIAAALRQAFEEGLLDEVGSRHHEFHGTPTIP